MIDSCYCLLLYFDDAKVEIISFPPNKTLLIYSKKYHSIRIIAIYQ